MSGPIPNKKSVFTAYLLWLFGGIFGAHHFYLKRDRHAFVWCCTLGGYFGIGWMYEIFKIPSYVRDANEDKEFMDKFKATLYKKITTVNCRLKKFPKSPFSTIRFLGAIMVGYLFGELIKQAIPEVINSEGDEIPVHEAIKNILSAPFWSEIKESISETYKYAQHKGWYAVFKELFSIMDDDGTEKAHKTLNLSAAASESEITAAYRKLSKENHPDKLHDEDKRKEVQERFMEIQQAYELLSKRKMKRKSRNKKFNDDL